MSMKLFVKQTPETIANGIAGLQVANITAMGEENSVLMLTLYVKDADGGLSGPYKIRNDDTELKEAKA